MTTPTSSEQPSWGTQPGDPGSRTCSRGRRAGAASRSSSGCSRGLQPELDLEAAPALQQREHVRELPVTGLRPSSLLATCRVVVVASGASQ